MIGVDFSNSYEYPCTECPAHLDHCRYIAIRTSPKPPSDFLGLLWFLLGTPDHPPLDWEGGWRSGQISGPRKSFQAFRLALPCYAPSNLDALP